jgi:prephenate dehydrogenase
MPTWNNVAVIGPGLIGGSIGLALRKRKLANAVVGIGRREASLQAALARGCVTQITTNLADGVREADLVIVCTPVDSIAQFVQRAAQHCPLNCLLTDAGSTKEKIVAAIEAANLKQPFVGSHPIAGSEKNGPEAASADLFEGRVAVVTSTKQTNANAAAAVESFWQSVGARTIQMEPSQHDHLVARTSHLPHLVASTLAATTPCDDDTELLTGTGWADTTRIASGDPDLWREIFLANSDATLFALTDFETVLKTWRKALETGNGQLITALLKEGKLRRDALGN